MIKWTIRIFYITLLLIAIALGAIFTSENNQPTTLVLFGNSLQEMQLGFWILLVFLLGGLVGLLLSFLTFVWGKQTVASKDRKIRHLEKELNQLRTAGIKG